MAQLCKLENLQRANQRLKEDLEKFQGRFTPSKSRIGYEVPRLRGLVVAAEARGFDAEVAQQTLQVYFTTK